MLPECGFKLIHKSHDCDVGPVGHGCVLDAGTYMIQWNDGDQLPFIRHIQSSGYGHASLCCRGS